MAMVMASVVYTASTIHCAAGSGGGAVKGAGHADSACGSRTAAGRGSRLHPAVHWRCQPSPPGPCPTFPAPCDACIVLNCVQIHGWLHASAPLSVLPSSFMDSKASGHGQHLMQQSFWFFSSKRAGDLACSQTSIICTNHPDMCACTPSFIHSCSPLFVELFSPCSWMHISKCSATLICSSSCLMEH